MNITLKQWEFYNVYTGDKQIGIVSNSGDSNWVSIAIDSAGNHITQGNMYKTKYDAVSEVENFYIRNNV